MLVKGTFTQMSGSLGGITAARNAGGQYLRARTIPINPNTVFQQAVRGIVSQLSNLWINTLTEAQRVGWETYAENVEVINRLGDSINITGMNMYVRSNTARVQALQPRVDTAPVIFDLGDYTPPSFVLDQPNSEVDVAFTDTDDWVNEDDAAMLVYASRPVNQTVNFFKGPYRFAGTILGDAITAPTSPAAIALPFAVAVGQRIHLKAVVSRADGRYSSPFLGQADAA